MPSSWEIRQGDCLEVMATLPENSVDAVVTDPPYGLEFMGKEWDSLFRTYGPGSGRPTKPRMSGAPDTETGNPWASERPSHGGRTKQPRCMRCGKLMGRGTGVCKCPEPVPNTRHAEAGYQMQFWHERWATEAFRILKPGGHLAAFGGSRTYHRMACAVEDAGFEIRDQLQWLYGSGFPKSLDISKAIDKAAGAEREIVGPRRRPDGSAPRTNVAAPKFRGTTYAGDEYTLAMSGNDAIGTAPATSEAQRWQGWGTALKPAHEPIVLARKPLSERNVAANVERWGTGGINVDGGRIEGAPPSATGRGITGARSSYEASKAPTSDARSWETPAGRWPPNVALDESAAAMVDEQSGESSGIRPDMTRHNQQDTGEHGIYGRFPAVETPRQGDSGGASRFMYVAKADRAEREIGLGHLASQERRAYAGGKDGLSDPRMDRLQERRDARNNHPTVKPVALMAWLCRLVTPPKGLILDPFCGSGSTGIAALREGFSFLGIEREPEYVEIARARIEGDAPLFNMEAT